MGYYKHNSEGKIYMVGLGPGARDLMTPRALAMIEESNVIVGYISYIEYILDLVVGKKIISTGMREELERCHAAIDEAMAGSVVSVVCSGDPGVYGMSGLILELLHGRNDIEVEVAPGVTAATAAAAVLGAPLMNDFAVISLSDILTPRAKILGRARLFAESDIVCVLYNPRSASRRELFDKVISMFIEKRGADILAGIVRNASRQDESVWVGRLGDILAEAAKIDMSSVVVVGSSDTVMDGARMYTKRGYSVD